MEKTDSKTLEKKETFNWKLSENKAGQSLENQTLVLSENISEADLKTELDKLIECAKMGEDVYDKTAYALKIAYDKKFDCYTEYHFNVMLAIIEGEKLNKGLEAEVKH